MQLSMYVLAAAVAIAACKTQPVTAEEPPPPTVAKDGAVTVRARVRLPLHARGLSGLARDEAGRLWSIPERGRRLLPLSLSGTTFEPAGESVRLEGVPAGWDTESLAWLGPDTFAFGTETQDPQRAHDHVVIARVEGHTARVIEKIAMPYATWGIKARVNRGIEGLCHVDGILVAGNENVIEDGEARWAPLARYDIATKRWEWFRLRLVSKAGKVSAVACRASADVDQLDVLAIERHYGISRLLRFSIPRSGPGGDIDGTQVADLGKLVAGVPNMEGLDWRGTDVVVFVDNDTGGVTGPCEAILLRFEE